MSDIPLYRLERARRNLDYLTSAHCCEPDGECGADDGVDTPYPEDRETISQLLDEAIATAERHARAALEAGRHA